MSALPFLTLALSVVGQYEMFGYQIHSWNDFRQWPAAQARAKLDPGFVRFKIDPNYVNNEAFCKRHGFTTPDCIIFSHDNPDLQETYNTSIEFAIALHMIPFSVLDLCMKYPTTDDPCGNQGFINRTQEMFDSLASAVEALKITLIFDGVLTPTNRSCMLYRPSTFYNTQDPIAAATSNTGSYAQYEANVIMCCEENVKVMSELNPPYGKFATNLQYPLQLWEPTNQSRVLDTASLFKTTGYGKQKLLMSMNEDPMLLKNFLTEAEVPGTNRETLIATGNSVNGSLYFAPGSSSWANCSFFPTSDRTFTLFESCGEAIAGYDLQSDEIIVSDRKCTKLLMTKQHASSGLKGDRIVSMQCSIADSTKFVFISSGGSVADVQGVVMNPPQDLNVTSGYTLLPRTDATFYAGGSDPKIYALAGTVVSEVGVGSFVRGAHSAGDEIVLITKDSYCYNCEAYNKRPTPRMCDQTAVSMRNVLSYTVGNVSAIMQSLASASYPIMHACSAPVIHNSFGSGYRAAPVFEDNHVNVAYEPISSTSDCTEVCGCPIPRAADSPLHSFALTPEL